MIRRRIASMIPSGRRQAALATATAACVVLACDSSRSRAPIEIDQLGPQVGDRVPDFALPDQHGRVVGLDSILGPSGALLMFYRSADW